MIQERLFYEPQKELGTDDLYSPKWIFDALDIKFDLDVASPSGGCHWIPAERYYDQEADGLVSEWVGNVWMNPPYSKMTPWANKFMNHRNGIALLPFAKSKWMYTLFRDDNKILLLPVNLTFIDPKNLRGKDIPWSCILVAYGAQNQKALKNIGPTR